MVGYDRGSQEVPMRLGYSVAAFALAVIAAATLAHARPAAAAVPSPSTSSWDNCLVWCPEGDIPFHVVIRDLANNPQPNSSVDIRIFGCNGVDVCPLNGSEAYTLFGPPGTQFVRQIAAADGSTTFRVRAGGTCPSVSMTADGVAMFISKPLRSPDLNGDGVVNATDRNLMIGLMGTSDAGADLNCDAVVSQADLDLLNLHYGHACGGATPTRRSSWGALKVIYR